MVEDTYTFQSYDSLIATKTSDGTVYLDDIEVGSLNAFSLHLKDKSISSSLFFKSLKKALEEEITNRVKDFYSISD